MLDKLGLALVIGYAIVALLTGLTRPQTCASGSLTQPGRSPGVVATVVMGAFWPYTLYRFQAEHGSVDGFFSRNGLCTPAR